MVELTLAVFRCLNLDICHMHADCNMELLQVFTRSRQQHVRLEENAKHILALDSCSCLVSDMENSTQHRMTRCPVDSCLCHLIGLEFAPAYEGQTYTIREDKFVLEQPRPLNLVLSDSIISGFVNLSNS